MIKHKIMILILVTVLASSALTSVAYIAVTKHVYIDNSRRELIAAAKDLADDIADDGYTFYSPSARQGHNVELLRTMLWVWLGDKPRVVNPGDGTDGNGAVNSRISDNIEITQAQFDKIYSGKVSVITTPMPKLLGGGANGDAHIMLTIGVPIWRGDTVVGAVILSRPISEVFEMMSSLNFTLLLFALFSFLIMQIPGYIATTRITTPINQAAAVASSMSAGDYSVRAPESYKGEIGELCRAMNSFAKAAGILEQTRRDYVANVSHELRTPITSIRAMGETLLDGMADSDEKRELFYNNIVRESGRLSRLVNDLLELSRLQSGRSGIETQEFDLAPALRNVYDMFVHVAEDCDVTFEVRDITADTVITAYGNADRVEQVLVILADNAIQHTPDGGKVTVSRSEDKDICRVYVTNTGSHIDEEHLPYIFDRFYKADKAHTGGGSGLGLSIAREIMTLLGGGIHAENLREGDTDTVRFVLTVRRSG